jgi:hypothetical protein
MYTMNNVYHGSILALHRFLLDLMERTMELMVSLWNELPENINCSSSVNIFKHKLRKYLLGNHS